MAIFTPFMRLACLYLLCNALCGVTCAPLMSDMMNADPTLISTQHVEMHSAIKETAPSEPPKSRNPAGPFDPSPRSPPAAIISQHDLEASNAESPFKPNTAVAADMLNVTIVIPTVRRFQNDGTPAPEQYLAPLVQKLWNDLTFEQRKYVKFLILNSDKEPEKHIEALSLASIPAVKILTKPNWQDQVDAALKAAGNLLDNGQATLEDGRAVNGDWMHWVAGEDIDAAYLFELAQNMSPYILFLEDDVWPTTNALTKLTRLTQQCEHKDWLFLDLYTPNLNWAAGMLDVKNAEQYPFQCCTQSMLFRSDLVPDIITYLRAHPGEPFDDNLRNYREKVTPNRYIFASRPNLFEHVGAYSSNPQKSTGYIEHQSLDFLPLLIQLNTTTAL